MSIHKIPFPLSIPEAAKGRIAWTLDILPRICVSFSGGRDSGLMLHLTAEVARQMGKKICVSFIGWEAQFSCTINCAQSLRKFYVDVIEEFYRIVLPLTTRNPLPQYQPEWQCWEPDVEWVRQPPQDAITDPDFFSFHQPGMTFERFVREFAEWSSQKRLAAMMISIRADEPYNRFVAIISLDKQRFADGKSWTIAAPGGHSQYTYPIYDWKVADIWTWYANHQQLCDPLYNIMYQTGVPLRHMRIYEPFSPEQRQGLWLYHVVEPDRWVAMCARVSGAKSGGIYTGHGNHFYGHWEILKPKHLDWQEYALLLLNSMPEKTVEHYRNRIAIYLHWYQKKGIEVPQTQQGDIGAEDVPS